MNLSRAIHEIIHQGSVREVVESLLLEMRCPVCDSAGYMQGFTSGPSCTSKQCIHYDTNDPKGWQKPVRLLLKKYNQKKKPPRDWNTIEKIVGILDAAKVPLFNQYRIPGMDILAIFDRHTGRSIPMGIVEAYRISEELSRVVSIGRSDEVLLNTKTPRNLTYKKTFYDVGFGPVINDTAVEKWAKKTMKIMVFLEMTKESIRTGHILSGTIRHSNGDVSYLEDVKIGLPTTGAERFTRFAGEKIKSLYNNTQPPSGRATKDVSIKGTSRSGTGYTIQSTRLQPHVKVVGRDIPRFISHGGEAISMSDVYTVLSISVGRNPDDWWVKLKNDRTRNPMNILVQEDKTWKIIH